MLDITCCRDGRCHGLWVRAHNLCSLQRLQRHINARGEGGARHWARIGKPASKKSPHSVRNCTSPRPQHSPYIPVVVQGDSKLNRRLAQAGHLCRRHVHSVPHNVPPVAKVLDAHHLCGPRGGHLELVTAHAAVTVELIASHNGELVDVAWGGLCKGQAGAGAGTVHGRGGRCRDGWVVGRAIDIAVVNGDREQELATVVVFWVECTREKRGG